MTLRQPDSERCACGHLNETCTREPGWAALPPSAPPALGRHKYADGPKTKCRLCGLRWGNPIHSAPRHTSVTTARSLIRTAIHRGYERSSDFFNLSGRDAAALTEYLVDQVLASQPGETVSIEPLRRKVAG